MLGRGRLAGAVGAALVILVTALPAAHVAAAEGDRHGPWLPTTPDQWPLVVDEQQTAPRVITRGITQHADTLQTVGGAQVAQVMNVDLADPNVRTGVVESHDHLTDPSDETISSMAHRTGAVAGINGDFFEIYGSGRPLGMVIQDGRLVKSPNPGWTADLGVRRDGSFTVGTETYTASVADGQAGHPLTSVNTVNDIGSGGMTRVTPDLGATPIPTATVVSGHLASDRPTLVVDRIDAGVTSLPTLAAGTEDLAGGGQAGQWLAATVKPGDRIAVTEQIAPDAGLVQAISGGAILVQGGKIAVPLQGPGENNINDPVTGVGITADGRHAIVAVFDGHQPEDSAEGLTRPQLAGWMIEHGAHDAILFDSGGSSQIVGRVPGQTQASVLNTPSDGHERPVANGLFFYSTAAAAGPTTTAVVNGGRPLDVLAGATVPLPAYATDARGNPARDAATVSVRPDGLATVANGSLTAGSEPGRGRLLVRAGDARSSEPLRVVDRLASLSMSPAAPDLDNGASQTFTLAATGRDGSAVALTPQSATWSVSPASLGTVTSDGTFTAAAGGSGLATVTAVAGGATATASVAVGQSAAVVDPMTDVAAWALRGHGGATGSLALSTTEKAQPTDTGSMDVKYDIPAGQGVKQVVFFPNTIDDSFPAPGTTQVPTGVGVWVKGTGTADPGGPPLGLGDLTLADSFLQVNGQAVTFYPSTVTYAGWRLIVAKLPPGLQYPLSVNFLDFLVINPSTELAGHLYVSDLEALYSPRLPAPVHYVPVPDNPDWLQYEESPASFSHSGTTMAALDDAHTMADNTGSTGSVVMHSMPGVLGALPPVARPSRVQALGDMSDTGSEANLQYAKSLLDGVGLPYRNAVGNHEITQGGDPENVNFTSVYGDTHYAYDAGAARVIVADNAHGGILASDPFQVPAAEQYQWLVAQLSANTARVAFVVVHMPAYDPHPVANSQFADRWEARMYETLLIRYQRTHPRTHLIALFGHARGYAEQLLDPQGDQVQGGLPNFVVADAGVPPYAAVNEGGFFNYALFHVTPHGTVQFAVQPFLASIAVDQAPGTLARGQQLQLTATGISPAGDDLSALHVPIADPASHVWSSSNPWVARVDPRTGTVTARHAGTVEISIASGGVAGHVTLTVTS